MYPFTAGLVREVLPNWADQHETTLVLALMFLGIIPAILLSWHTINRIDRSGGNLKGRRLALAALAIGLVSWMLLALVAMIYFVS
jgi:hypothetical protein